MDIDKYEKWHGEDLLEVLDYSFVFGDPHRPIKGPAPLLEADETQISFCKFEGEEAIPLIKRSNAGMLLVHESVPKLDRVAGNSCLVAMKNPRLGFIRCLNTFFRSKPLAGAHKTAVIDAETVLPKQFSIGAQAIIGKKVIIGEGVIIGPRVLVMDHSVLGKDVVIQAGAVIGCDGQGFERNEDGRFEKFPQVGRVVLQDYVEIGSNCTIVRGAMPGVDTVIGEGTKIGHLVSVGKNVNIGRHCLISAGAILCGSVEVGDYAWLAPRCVIRQKIKIGQGAVVGLGAVVVSDVKDGITVAGVPAKPIK